MRSKTVRIVRMKRFSGDQWENKGRCLADIL